MPVEVAHQGERLNHEKGRHLLVNDGHLWVMDSTFRDASPTAVYAPGQWSNAVINSRPAEDMK